MARISLDEPVLPGARQAVPAPFHQLTPREREVLALLVAGRTYGEIAHDLVVSEKTVSVHVSHILGKTRTSSRVQAAALARRLGLADPAAAGRPSN